MRPARTSSAPGALAARQTALDFGAQEFVDLDTDALEDIGEVDLVFDVLGGDIAKRSAGVIRAGGTLVTVTGPTEARPSGGRTIDFVVEPDRAQSSELVQRVRVGLLRTNIGEVAALDDAVTAFNRTERIKGKTIIRVHPARGLPKSIQEHAKLHPPNFDTPFRRLCLYAYLFLTMFSFSEARRNRSGAFMRSQVRLKSLAGPLHRNSSIDLNTGTSTRTVARVRNSSASSQPAKSASARGRALRNVGSQRCQSFGIFSRCGYREKTAAAALAPHP